MYMIHRGVIFPTNSHDEESLDYAENRFQVWDEDIFNVTYPKSGTTWMQQILTLIHSNGDPTLSRSVPSWERVPWIEQRTAHGYLETRPSPRLITSHLPVQFFPKSLFHSKAKVIYTARNPKDTFVSLYHFYNMSGFLEDPGATQDFLNKFLSGEVIYGSWFDHLRGWLGVKDKVNLLFITYEELLQDPRGSVIKVCNFIGKKLDDKAIDSVVENSSFKSMKENQMTNYSLVPDSIMNQKKSPFMRKACASAEKNKTFSGVLRKPILLLAPAFSGQLLDGDEVFLTCGARSRGATRFELHKDGVLLKVWQNPEGRHSAEFQIPSVGPQDEGNYTCSYEVGQSGESNLHSPHSDPKPIIISGVLPKPVLFLYPNSSKDLSEGEQARLGCDGSRYDVAWLYLYKNGDLIAKWDPSAGSGAYETAPFLIDSVRSGEQGNYTCRYAVRQKDRRLVTSPFSAPLWILTTSNIRI
ncbi:sulfotransferase 2A1 isoform X2 [Latimeria chalumnae]|nr:PREDICTED: sulfotransferase family cytosolic 2B member 1 isoform X2 [Latimeria chalumnae]XP_006005693.1 PREDICTED: sulfotransferase family cytosolic 2B member 1 isoform X2 [Latimeria chalumnae]XP_014349759.1 PREDICTED: sulfotransferase family cytosolic 2B member 1 isoform X2 [Latimeria chalumnae]|eukprot:XP_006005692.1 PREDICTED: sulfotransferase family cytosolic 2B member 1 isoform X2 [Latimeria chalumnae]